MTNLAMRFLLGLPGTRRLSVLAYHRVLPERDPLLSGEPSADEFEHRMRWVKGTFDVLPLGEAVRALRADRLPRRALRFSLVILEVNLARQGPVLFVPGPDL